jgi:hypothetical protein
MSEMSAEDIEFDSIVDEPQEEFTDSMSQVDFNVDIGGMQDVELVENSIKAHMNTFFRQTTDVDTYFNILKDALQESNAVIAGGAVVSALTGAFSVNDLDIYVSSDNYLPLLKTLAETLKLKLIECRLAPPYDESFFKRNHIIARYSFAPPTQMFFDWRAYVNHLFDVLVVHKGVDIHSVVGNFDLSFCSVLYDGSDVLAVDTTIQEIKRKKGVLKPTYHGALANGNAFTLNRLIKYIKRGFSIDMGNTALVGFEKQYRKKLVEQTGTEWIILKVIDYIKKRFVSILGTFTIPDFIIDEDYSDTNRVVQAFATYLNSLHQDPATLVAKVLYYVEDTSSAVTQDYRDYYQNFMDMLPTPSEDATIIDLDTHIKSLVPVVKLYRELEVVSNVHYQEVLNRLNGQGYDVMMVSDVDIAEWLQEDPDNLVFLCDEEIICLHKSYVLLYYNDKDDNWFYECTEPTMSPSSLKRDNPYIGLPLSKSQHQKRYISEDTLASLLFENTSQIYEVKRDSHIDDDGRRIFAQFNYTATYKNVHGEANYVSSNHCQGQTQILLDKLFIVEQ